MGRLQARVNHQVCLYDPNPAGGGLSRPTRGRRRYRFLKKLRIGLDSGGGFLDPVVKKIHFTCVIIDIMG